jgi:hypothetical protein
VHAVPLTRRAARTLALVAVVWLLSGDVGGNVDVAPNAQQREGHAVLKGRLEAQMVRFAGLTRTGLAALNRLLQEKGVAGIIVPAVK